VGVVEVVEVEEEGVVAPKKWLYMSTYSSKSKPEQNVYHNNNP
jgi:U3 small nucleolar ribonucleoprotein component